MEEQTRELSDYLVAIKKRKRGILTISSVVLLIGVILAFSLPPVYKSSSTILIEQQEIPRELVMTTVTGYASERIQIIKARVMSRANLLKIVEKFNLYEHQRRFETKEETLARVTENISLDIISAEVVDPRTGRPGTATIAFSLSFKDEIPKQAQRVVSELTSLYLNENLKTRTQKAEDASKFLKQESERLSEKISELDTRIATFKQEHKDELPEIQKMNLQQLQRKELELANIQTRVSALDDKKFYLEGQLALIEPDNPAHMSASTRLKLAEAEYLSVKAKYSEQHPDVIKLERQIDALRLEVAPDDHAKDLARNLIELRGELVVTRDKYTADHPDVVRLQQEIKTLEHQLKTATSRVEDDYYKKAPDNPAYITLNAQLASIGSELKAINEQKLRVDEEIKEIETMLSKGPEVEREYSTMLRDYQNAVREYQESKQKQSKADVAKQLESENKGERFSLIDPPAMPEKPVSPNRPAIFFLSLVLSLGSGLAYAFVADAISGSVRGARNVQFLLGAVPLAVVPFQSNASDMQKRKKLQKRTILLGFVILVAVVMIIHFFITPLDVLWFRSIRKFEMFTS